MFKTNDTNYLPGLIDKRKRNKGMKSHSYIKNCGGCRAYKDDKCLLKIPIRIIKEVDGIPYHAPVTQNCPKPRTKEAYRKAGGKI